MSFENIKLEKGMYGVCDKSFTNVLESLDPSDDYRGTELEGLDAYQRQLKRFGIKVAGAGCDIVDKFFQCAESAVLFPEFISRGIKKGMEINNVIPEIISTKVITNGVDYRPLQTNVESVSSNVVSETDPLSQILIKNETSAIKLRKYGHVISTSYEALRLQNLEVISVILHRIGMSFVNYQLKELVSALGTYSRTTASSLTYESMLTLWRILRPYNMNVILCSYKTAKDILSLSEFRDSNAGLDFHGTGKLINPLGAKIVCTNSMDDDVVVGFDKSFAFQMMQMGDLVVDYNKIIDKQLENSSISLTFIFSKMLSSSVKGLDYSNSINSRSSRRSSK